MAFLFNYRISAFSAIDIDAIEMGNEMSAPVCSPNAVTKIVCFFYSLSLLVLKCVGCMSPERECLYNVRTWLCVAHLKYTNALRMLQFYTRSKCLTLTEERARTNECYAIVCMQTHIHRGHTVMCARENRRRWFGCKLLFVLFVSRNGRERERRREGIGWSAFVFVCDAPRRWLLFDFIHVGCMCFPISATARPNAFLQRHFIPLIHKWWRLKAFYSRTECDFGQMCAVTGWLAG